MSKFTIGPWHVTNQDDLCAAEIASNADGHLIAMIREPYRTREEYKANARLIAAAPDLYDAADTSLNTLLACCVPGGGIDDRKTMLETVAKLRAAISKATGQ